MEPRSLLVARHDPSTFPKIGSKNATNFWNCSKSLKKFILYINLYIRTKSSSKLLWQRLPATYSDGVLDACPLRMMMDDGRIERSDVKDL